MLWVAYILLASSAAGGNLLANPGFEELSGEEPARWNCYVAPMEGAFGRLDDTAHEGKYAVMLHIPTPYEKDPANNWSQNVIGDFAKKKLRLSAFIKTKDASEAAVWVQCWRKDPWGVLLAMSTSQDAPVYGTHDWERVEMSIDAPENTDFLTVRCVLKGTGTAWFDDIRIEQLEEAKKEEKIPPAPEHAKSAPASVTPKEPPAPAKAPAESKTAAPCDDRRVKEMESELSQLRESNKDLKDTLGHIRTTNKELVRELSALQGQLKDLQQQLRTTPQPPESKAEASIGEGPRTPPLVPHGTNEKDYDACK